MKNKNINNLNALKILTLLIVLTVFSLNMVSAVGITGIAPGIIELSPGESTDFIFGISAPDAKISCTYSLDETFPLEVVFDEDPAIINANGEKYIYATVTAPTGVSYNDYTGRLCIECNPLEEGVVGSGVKFIPCTSLRVNVVSERTLVNPKIRPEISGFPWWILLLILIILIIIIAYIIYRKWRQTQFSTKPIKKSSH